MGHIPRFYSRIFDSRGPFLNFPPLLKGKVVPQKTPQNPRIPGSFLHENLPPCAILFPCFSCRELRIDTKHSYA